MSSQNHEESVYGHDLELLTISLYSVIETFHDFESIQGHGFQIKNKKKKSKIKVT